MVRKVMYKNKELQGYYIFDNGKVWSSKSKKFLTQRVNNKGYLRVGIYDNKDLVIEVHVLMAYAFLGNPPACLKDPTVDHIDNNKLNNTIGNIQWLERGDNSAKVINRHGQRFSKKEIHKICKDIINGLDDKQIMKKYNINKSYICNIKNCKYQPLITELYFQKSNKQPVLNKMHEICKDIEEGLLTRKEICDKNDISWMTLNNITNGTLYSEISKLYNMKNIKVGKKGRPKK